MHLEGKPHGPSLSFGSTVGFDLLTVVARGIEFVSEFVVAAAFSSFTSPFERPGSQKLTLLTTAPKCSPRDVNF